VDSATGQLVSDDVREQTRQCLDNSGKILKASNSSFENVVKAIVYLDDMANYAAVNEEYLKYFQKDPPARVCVAVKALPRNAKVEIELTAVSND